MKHFILVGLLLGCCSLGWSQNPKLLKKFSTGQCCEYIHESSHSGNYMYFAKGFTLWKTDGTPQNTQIVTEKVRVLDRYDSIMADLNGTLYFIASDTAYESNFELWKTDGTDDGTVLFKEFTPGPNGHIEHLVSVGGMLFFVVYDRGATLWRSDGTEEGTIKIKDIFIDIPRLAVLEEAILFVDQSKDFEIQFWTTDGTESGTAFVKNFENYLDSYKIVNYQNNLYFSNGLYAGKIWKSDGTNEGTIEVLNLEDGYVRDIIVFKEHLYFTVMKDRKYQLWKSDGTAEGSSLILNIDADVVELYALEDGILMMSENDSVKLLKSDGSARGTYIIKELKKPSSYIDTHFTNQKLYFTIDEALWETNGTEAGTIPVKVYENPLQLRLISSSKEQLFFTTLDYNRYDTGKYQFWSYNINTPPTGGDLTLSIPPNFVASLDELFFFKDANPGDQREKVRINAVTGKGTLFIDRTPNQVPDTDEIITDTTEISASEIPLLIFRPDEDEVGSNYAQLKFAVSDGYDYSEEYTMTINVKQYQTISWDEIADQTEGDTLVLSAITTSGLPISYDVEGPATVKDSLLIVEGSGKITVTATQAGNDLYFKADTLSQTFFAEAIVVTGLADLEIAVDIYPNPTQDKITIQLDDPSWYGSRIAVTDLLGNVVANTATSSPRTSIDVSQQVPGVYFVNIQSKQRNYTFKILKQ